MFNPCCHLSHMFFLCPRLHDFWSGFFNIISIIIGIHLQPCPLIAIFGTPDKSDQFNWAQKEILKFTSLLARRRILLQWKSPNPPSVSQWLTDAMHFLKLEKIKYAMKGNTDKFF